MSQKGIRVMFNRCIHLLKSPDLAYCLRFREWLNQCPKRCQEHSPGEIGGIAETEQKKYNIECLHFSRREPNDGSNPVYFCNLMMQESPFCYSCHFPLYKENS